MFVIVRDEFGPWTLTVADAVLYFANWMLFVVSFAPLFMFSVALP